MKDRSQIMARNTLFCLAFLIVPFSAAAEGFQNRPFYENVNSALSSDDLEKLDSLLNVSRLSEQKGSPVVSQFVFQALNLKAFKCLKRLMELCPDGTATKAFPKTVNSSCKKQQEGINLCNFWEAASETSSASLLEFYMTTGCGRCLAHYRKLNEHLGQLNKTRIDPLSVEDDPDLSQCKDYSTFWMGGKESDEDGGHSSGSEICKKPLREDIFSIYGDITSRKGDDLENKGLQGVRNALENWKSNFDRHLSRLCSSSTTVERVSEEVFGALSIENVQYIVKEKEISDPQQSFVHCMAFEKSQNRTTNESCSVCSHSEYKNTAPEGKGMDLTQEKVVQMCGRCLKKTVDVYGHRFVLNSTRQGDIFRSACPVNHKSTFVSWTCRHDSTWDAHPDLSLCRGNTALFPVPAGSTTLGPLENITTLINNIQNVDLYPAEAVTVLEGVAELQRKFQEEDLEKNFDAADRGSFFRSVVDVAANVLREPMSFEVNNAARGRMLSSAQDLLTNSSLRFGERLQPNTAVTYKQEGVHVFVEKRPAAHFREERNRLLLHEYSHTTSVLLPEDFYDGYETAENGDQFVLVQKTTYRDLHTRYNRNLSNIDIDLTGYIDYKSVVNSHVIGVTVGSGKWEATSDQLVHINSSHNYYGESLRLSNIKCVWWDSSGDDWSTEGCSLNWTTAEYSVCHCDHLTSFALIMDIYGYRPPKSSSQATEELVLHLISEIGSCVSILCLVLTILSTRIVMLAKKSQRQDRSTKPDLTMIHLCLCLCLFFCLFLPRVTAKTSEELCITITFFRHYFLMATFTWNAVWSVFLFLGIIQVLSKITVTTKQILIAGYFLPLVIVVFSLVLSICLEIYARKDVCWIAPGFALWSFIGAISIILLVNLVIYVKVVRVMWTRSHPTTYNDCAKLRGSVSIFLGLGLTWSVGWFLMLEESPSFYLKIIFNLLNSLQGVGIFLLNVPLHGKNWKLIKGFIDNWMKTRGYQCWTSLETQDLRLDEINSGYKRYMGSRFTTETSLKDTEDSDKK